MTVEIRLTQPHEYRLAANAFLVALMVPSSHRRAMGTQPAELAGGTLVLGVGRRDLRRARLTRHRRHHGLGWFRLSTSAVTRIGILPTYRRPRPRHRPDASPDRRRRAARSVLMSLRASEAVIYQRYGFGVAGDFCEATIDPQRVSPIAGATTVGSFRILEPDEIVDTLGPLYERVAHRRPGVLTRPRHWTTRQFRAAIERKEASFVAVHHDVEGELDGYVHYTVTWSDGMNAGSTGLGDVHELLGATDAVELALWQYIVDTDLVTRWKTVGRPVDDLVRLAAHDRRGYQQTSIEDEQWLRLIDTGPRPSGTQLQPGIGLGHDSCRRSTDPRQQWNLANQCGRCRTDRRSARPVCRDRDHLGRLPRWSVLGGTRRDRRRRGHEPRRDRHRRHTVRQPPTPLGRHVLLTSRGGSAPGCGCYELGDGSAG